LGRENENPELFYWLRERNSANAEVDFVWQSNREIIPIEVKSGKSGSLRSLHQFMYHKGGKRALRFDTNEPSNQVISHSIRTGTGSAEVEYDLISLPLYLAGETKRLLNSR